MNSAEIDQNDVRYDYGSSSSDEEENTRATAATTTTAAVRPDVVVVVVASTDELPVEALRRESFIEEFANSKGPPQIVLLIMMLALGFGSTIGVVRVDRFRTICWFAGF